MGLQVIYSRLDMDFPMEPQAWDLRARRCLSGHHAGEGADAVEAAEAVYREGVAATEGLLMYELYVAFLREQLEASLEASGADLEGHLAKLKGQAKSLAKQILRVRLLSSSFSGCTAATCSRPKLRRLQAYASLPVLASNCRASSCGTRESEFSELQVSALRWPQLQCPDHARAVQVCQAAASAERASEEILLEWPRLALRFGRIKASLAACEQATALAPTSAELWRQRLVLETQHAISKALFCPCCSRSKSV